MTDFFFFDLRSERFRHLRLARDLLKALWAIRSIERLVLHVA
jgi:hypothetical protein